MGIENWHFKQELKAYAKVLIPLLVFMFLIPLIFIYFSG